MKLPAKLSPILKPDIPIYALSPHCDDVIWSAGGFLQSLAEAGHEITLVSIFTHSIYVYEAIRPPAEVTAIRKGEDFSAARAAGFKNVVSLDYPDGILRDTPQDRIFNSSYQPPEYLLSMITDSISRLIPSNCVVLVPAGFGAHMDHLTVRQAAMRLRQRKLAYADMPYAAHAKEAFYPSDFLQQYGDHIALQLTRSQIEEHTKLFWQYRSQASEAVADEIELWFTSHALDLWLLNQTAQ